MNLNKIFWDNRYKENTIGWDLGKISNPLKEYFDQLENINLKILIPGGGNSYEAEYLHQLGFKNVFVVDLSETALNNIKKRVPSFPTSHLILQDFFNLNLQFDLIIEQTFFCAINPSLRQKYADKSAEILNKNGSVVGLLFNKPLQTNHPPFGGSKEEYKNYFSPNFNIEIMEECINSEKSRIGTELFFKLIKK